MTGLLYKLFGFSFDALEAYEKHTNIFDDWVRAKNDINYKINTFVFAHLSKKYGNENSIAQQFCIDTVSSLLKKHYNRRLKLYQSVKQKQLFILFSLAIAWGELFMRLVLSINKFRYSYILQNDITVSETDVCIHFPKHAFSYEQKESHTHPRSFAEFLIAVEYAGIGTQNMLSVDEYERPSKKHEKDVPNNFVQPLTYKHEQLIVSRTKHGIKKTIAEINIAWRSYKQLVKNGNLFLLQEYFNQSHIAIRYLSVFKQLEERKINIRRVYVLSFFDIGLLKYGSVYDKLIRVFSYSQNLFIPPAPAISGNLLKGTMNVTLQEALEECESLIFSYYTHNPIGLTDHCFALNYFKSMVNKQFGLSLPVTMDRFESMPANVGYESLMDVEIGDGIKNIIVFDIPNETLKRDIGRTVIGDKAAKEDIVTAFYDDIVSLSMKYNCRILLKPKYSLSSPEFPASYKALIKSVQEKAAGRVVVFDPYVALKTLAGKIDLSISFPFTSTYYTIADICRQSVFYAPTPYETLFARGVETKLVLGKERLENIIKYL
jgi:hypothetical protein